jgi:hypothetical protein
LKEKSLYYFHKKLKFKKPKKKTFLVGFLGGFFWVGFLGGFFNANPADQGRGGTHSPGGEGSIF